MAHELSEEEEPARSIALSLSLEVAGRGTPLSASVNNCASLPDTIQTWVESKGGVHTRRAEEEANYDEENDAELARAIALSMTTTSRQGDAQDPAGELLSSFMQPLQLRAEVEGITKPNDTELDNRFALIESRYTKDVDFMTATAYDLVDRFETYQNRSDIDKAITLLELVVQTLPAEHVGKHKHWTNLGAAFAHRFEQTRDLADIDRTVYALQEGIKVSPDDHPDKPGRFNNLGAFCFRRFERTGDVVDLDKAISAQRNAVDLTPDGDRDKPGHLSNLAISLQNRFERVGQLADLDHSISVQRTAVNLTPDGHPYKRRWLNNLSDSFQSRFQQTGELMDLDQAISVQQNAVNLTPDGHSDKPALLNNLGISHLRRFEGGGELGDLNQAISVQSTAIHLTPDNHPNKPAQLHNLGISLLRRFERTGDLADLDRAISIQYTTVNLTPDDHPHKTSRLNGLGASLARRFEQVGELNDLDHAICVQHRAVNIIPDDHPDTPTWLTNLGTSLQSRFQRIGKLADIEQAISAQRKAVDLTPDGHLEKSAQLNNLGVSLQCLFERVGKLDDIDQAISVQRNAVNLAPDGHPDKHRWLNNLGISLLRRYERVGDLTDLDNAISVKQKAVILIPDGHPRKPDWLNNLGVSLQRRFERIGDPIDLDRAVSTQQNAVDLIPEGHPTKPIQLNNLGISLHSRFDQTGELADINRAISVQRLSVDLTPDDHPDQPSRLNNLSTSLQSRFDRVGELDDLDQAISVQLKATSLTPDDNPHKPNHLSNLGASLVRRFGRIGGLSDLEKGISAQRDAVNLTPDGHAEKPGKLNNLGKALMIRFRRLHDPADILAAIDAYRQSAKSISGSPTLRFRAAQHWARLALELPSHPDCTPSTVMDAYGTMMTLIPLVVWLGRTIHQRYQDMGLLGDSINEAAAVACNLHRYDLAVEWLEQGRSIVWGQIIHLRTPFDCLDDVDPALSSQLRQVARELESAGSTPLMGKVDSDRQMSLEESAQTHRQLAKTWDNLLKQVRSISGFESFLLPKTVSQLASVASVGAVALINVHSIGCDALILSPQSKDVRRVSLSASLQVLKNAQDNFRRHLVDAGARQRGSAPAYNGVRSKEIITNILTMLWKDVVRPILDTLGYMSSQSRDPLPRLTWCLTGPLAFLPLHAAGDYNFADSASRTFNRVVSSYTPSLTALLETAKSTNRTNLCGNGVLAVTQANVQGYSDLPGALEEISQLKKLMVGHAMQHLDDENATISAVSQAMERNRAVHFACHAIQDVGEPTKSGFVLRDGKLELGLIMNKRLPQAELAYLSACQTATGEERLPDEAVHLAAGMLIAGYPSVIATLWSIRDQDAPVVAEAFYRRILGGEGVRSADALHGAVTELRNKVGEEDFLSWVPFIHVGH